MACYRKYVLGKAALVEGRSRKDLKMQDQDKVERLLVDSNSFEHAPFG